MASKYLKSTLANRIFMAIYKDPEVFKSLLYSEQSLDDVSHYDQLTLFDDLPSLDNKDMSFCDRPVSFEEVTYIAYSNYLIIRLRAVMGLLQSFISFSGLKLKI